MKRESGENPEQTRCCEFVKAFCKQLFIHWETREGIAKTEQVRRPAKPKQLKLSGNKAINAYYFNLLYNMKKMYFMFIIASILGSMNLCLAQQKALTNDASYIKKSDHNKKHSIDRSGTGENEVWLELGDNGSYTVENTLTFYDDGGPDANCSYTFTPGGWITFVPANEGDVVRVTFDEFAVPSSYPLYIYDGKEVDESKLRAKPNTGTGVLPDGLFSTSSDGALTFFFECKSGGYKGWTARITSGQPEELYVKNIASSQVASTEVLRGSSNVAMQRIEVEIDGDFNFSTITFNELNFNAGTTSHTEDITGAKLFYTGTSTGFIDDNPFGITTTTNPYTFTSTEGITVDKPGKYYFWLAYDISENATADNTLSAQMISLKAGDKTLSSVTEESAVSRIIKAGFKGTYTIGTSTEADYATFEAATNAIAGGIEGAVRFEVEDGTYPENISVSNVEGASTKHPIVFTSKSGNNSDVIITGLPAVPNGVNGVVSIENTNHVTFENMTFKPTNQGYANIIYIGSVSRYFTLRNSILEANAVTSGYSGINGIRTVALSEEGKNNDYITIEGNTITGGYIGLYIGGTSTVRFTRERGAVVRDNTLFEQRSKGIYFYDEDNAIVERNSITNSTTNATGYAGIDFGRCRGTFIVRNNRISNSQSAYSYGIWLRSDSYGKSADEPGLVYNNAINISNASNASTYGLYIDGSTQNTSFYYNTVNISGTSGRAVGILSSNTPINVIIKNNLFQNSTAGNLYFISNQAQIDACSFSNNAYYFAGTAMTNAWGDDFDAWKSASGDTGSIVEQAQFLTASDLHLSAAGNLQMAQPVSFILTDRDSKPRHETTPTVGAYEYGEIVPVTPEVAEDYPKVGNIDYSSIEVKTKWNQTGKLYSLIRKAGETAPTVDELKAATPADVESKTEKETSFSGLDEETAYIAYFMVESVFGIWSDMVSSEELTTLKQIFPLELTIIADKENINAGETATISATITGGLEPYTITWKNQNNETCSETDQLIIQPNVSATYYITVKDALNTEVGARQIIHVSGGESTVATFDDLYLNSDSYWNGYEDEENSKFFSGSYSFSNYYYPEWFYWEQCAYSNMTGTTFEGMEHQYRSVVGHGVDGSENFGIIYGSGAIIKPTNTPSASIAGTYITNNAWTYDAIMNGDGMTPGAFGQGDFLKVIFTGKHADSSTSTVVHHLADYTSDNEDDHYVVTDWKWVDLSSLGEVTQVSISFESSRNNSYGMTTPGYLCIDNFGAIAPAVVSINDINTDIANTSIYHSDNTLYVKSDIAKYVINIYSATGNIVLREEGSLESKIDTNSLTQGVYIVEMLSKQGKVVTRIIKK